MVYRDVNEDYIDDLIEQKGILNDLTKEQAEEIKDLKAEVKDKEVAIQILNNHIDYLQHLLDLKNKQPNI
jgi:hypothetical protein